MTMYRSPAYVENERMSERFEWVPDLERGEWVRVMESEPLGSILSIVPTGFESYARIFHPVTRDRPHETKTWRGLDESTHFDGVVDIDAALETERVSWASAAASFGTTMHAEAQYARLVCRSHGDSGGAIPADGWRYSDSAEGSLDAAALSSVAGVLAHHTTTPDAGVAAIWEGWGGLLGSDGAAYRLGESNSLFSARSTMGRLASLVRAGSKSGSGLLDPEVAAGPRFGLHADTGRRYVLFEAGADDFADTSWPLSAPWVDEVTSAQSPSLLWPEDHSWVLATELDFDSTLVAGTAALIRELEQAPDLEVHPIRTDADLSTSGDAINLPE